MLLAVKTFRSLLVAVETLLLAMERFRSLLLAVKTFRSLILVVETLLLGMERFRSLLRSWRPSGPCFWP